MSDKRIFFALWPSDRQRDQLRNVISPAAKELEGVAVYRGNWHVTVAFVGEYPERLIPELMTAAQAVPFEPFRLRFDKVEFWPRAKVAVLVPPRVPSELERLVVALNSVLADVGVMVDPRVYRPHITIAQRSRPFETQRLAQPVIVEWTGIELIQSVSSPGSVVYSPLKQ
jgi:2'-5' RNA ligase